MNRKLGRKSNLEKGTLIAYACNCNCRCFCISCSNCNNGVYDSATGTAVMEFVNSNTSYSNSSSASILWG